MNCERCGKEDADYVADPYQEDINNKIVMMWLCRRCYEDIADDI